MNHGYVGKMLRIELGSGQVGVEPLNEEWALKYVGGTGLATRYLYEQIEASTKPDDATNPIIFMTGPLCATPSFTSGRHHVVAISPLTGIFGESDCGGSWGEQLKKAGFDGIIISGKSPKPIYLFVKDGQAELRSAEHLWGLDTYDFDQRIKRETHPKVSAACIGTAAENGALIAGIMHEGVHARAAGRCGLGAVMADKRLKAVVVRGNKDVSVFDRPGLKSLLKSHAAMISDRLKALRKYGTASAVQGSEQLGSMPIQNFGYPYRWEESAAKISGPAFKEKVILRPYFCRSCIIGCGKTVQVKRGPYRTVVGGGPEYETINMLGANCLVDNLEAICLANEMCNRYGIDTIDTGSLVAFAMEAFEKGIITTADSGGVTLKWGDADVMLEIVRMIGEGRHVGRVLGQGFARAVSALGPGADELAMQVKGLAISAHDPRAFNGLACSYATSSRGAHHTSGQTYAYEHRLEVPEINHQPPGRFVVEGKGALAALTQNIMNVLDSLKTCKFAQPGGWTIGPLTEALRYVTGRTDSLEELIRHGERSFNLKRLINIDRGISRKDDTLPKRLLTVPKTAQGYTPNIPPLEEMLDEYYQIRGWSEEGVPREDTMHRLEVP